LDAGEHIPCWDVLCRFKAYGEGSSPIEQQLCLFSGLLGAVVEVAQRFEST
jgi:hypothetical protein